MPALGLLLACAGSPAAPERPVTPPNTAAPPPVAAPTATAPPAPPDVEEKDGRCRWYGASFPLAGGELTNCSPRAVSTTHAKGEAAALLASYVKALVEAGFAVVDQPGDPTLRRGDLTVQLATNTSTEGPGVDVIAMRR